MPKHHYSNYYAHPKKTGAPRKSRAPPKKKKLDYEDDAEIIGLLPDDARLDLPTRAAMNDCGPPKKARAATGRKPRGQPKKLDDAEIIGTLPDRTRTNVFKFDFKSEAPVRLAFPHRPLGTGMSLEEMFKAIVDGDEPAQTTTKRQRDAEEDSDTTGHDGDDEKESARSGARATVAREVAGTKRRKLRV